MDELSLGNGTVGFHSFTLRAAVWKFKDAGLFIFCVEILLSE